MFHERAVTTRNSFVSHLTWRKRVCKKGLQTVFMQSVFPKKKKTKKHPCAACFKVAMSHMHGENVPLMPLSFNIACDSSWAKYVSVSWCSFWACLVHTIQHNFDSVSTKMYTAYISGLEFVWVGLGQHATMLLIYICCVFWSQYCRNNHVGEVLWLESLQADCYHRCCKM